MTENVRFNNNVITFNPSDEPLISLDETCKLKGVCIEGYRMYPLDHVLGWGEIWHHIKGRIKGVWKGVKNA